MHATVDNYGALPTVISEDLKGTKLNLNLPFQVLLFFLGQIIYYAKNLASQTVVLSEDIPCGIIG